MLRERVRIGTIFFYSIRMFVSLAYSETITFFSFFTIIFEVMWVKSLGPPKANFQLEHPVVVG